jgi:hypothetical protein
MFIYKKETHFNSRYFTSDVLFEVEISQYSIDLKKIVVRAVISKLKK